MQLKNPANDKIHNVSDYADATPGTNRIDHALYDYGKLYLSHDNYELCLPDSIEQVREILAAASGRAQPVRVRASGHTFNGCTLPQEGELLLRTNALDWYRLEKPGSIVVGGGVLVWDIRDFVEDFNYEMPVYNGGWAGPSIGGYINAGGFGKGSLSDSHGGLWENVLSITLVDMRGEVHVIDREDSRFQWVFGSYGQLGVIVEVCLKIVPKVPAAGLFYPKGQQGRVPRMQQEDPADNDYPGQDDDSILFWFSLMVAPEQEELAWQEMDAFCQRHKSVVNPDGGWAGPVHDGEPIGYRYNIRFHTFNPPLVYPKAEAFIVMGVMSCFSGLLCRQKHTILKIEKDFIELANRNQLKLYLQAENIGRNIDYRTYYGEAVYQHFARLKHSMDPQMLLNQGKIFQNDLPTENAGSEN